MKNFKISKLIIKIAIIKFNKNYPMYFISKKPIQMLCLLLFFNFTNAQDFFHELEIGKKFSKKNVNYFVDLSWKKEYNSNDWNRIGLNFSLAKSLKNNWTVSSGLENYYVFDPKAINYFEARPWVMISLKSKVLEKLYFTQFFKIEWRHFIFSSKNEYDQYNRLRYRFHFDYLVYDKTTKASIKPGIEWYILKKSSTNERYANSREYYLRCSIESNEREWLFGFKRETFYTTIKPNEEEVNSIFIELKF
jgi:hypothetical protein